MVTYQEQKKIAFLVNPEINVSNFLLKNLQTNQTVFTGNITQHTQNDTASKDNIYILDFSQFSSTGTYYIEISGIGKSYDLEISSNVYNYVFYKTMKSYYLQRCGMSVEYEVFKHGACHLQEQNSPYHTTILMLS